MPKSEVQDLEEQKYYDIQYLFKKTQGHYSVNMLYVSFGN